MWRVVKVCPKCMCGEFDKNEYDEYVCIECEGEYEECELETIDIQE